MRIVAIHRYFWPDTPPYAHILREIALSLGEAGHEVTVLTCQPSYNRAVVDRAAEREQLAPGVEVRRWPVVPDRRSRLGKGVNLVAFCARLLVEAGRVRRNGGADVVMAASAPPVAVAKVGSWFARRTGAAFVYHKQDIYPEVVTAPGILRAGRFAALLRWADARTERVAERVVVLSEDMAATVRRRGTDPDRIAVINNFDPWATDAAPQSPADHGALPADHGTARAGGRDSDPRLTVAFAGNLGRFQGLETVLAAATRLRDDPRIEFHFFGDGALRARIEQQVTAGELSRVHLHGYRAPEEVAAFLRDRADLGVVSLAPGVIRAAYPSKTMSYLRQGCPVLALVEADSELARTITGAGAGVHADPTDADDVAATLRGLADEPSRLLGAGKRAADLYQEQFAPKRQLGRWVELLEGVREDPVR